MEKLATAIKGRYSDELLEVDVPREVCSYQLRQPKYWAFARRYAMIALVGSLAALRF
jgi:hypothetical protein